MGKDDREPQTGNISLTGRCEMKNVLYIVLSFLLLTGCSGEPEKVVSYLQDRGGVWYEKNTEVPFTGVLVETYDDGQKWIEKHYKDGKGDGVSTIWYENGQKKVEGNWTSGKWNGLWTHWDENGQKRSEGNNKDGENDGTWTYWDKDGNITSTKTWKDGELVQ